MANGSLPERVCLTGNAGISASGLGSANVAFGSVASGNSPGSTGMVISGGSVSSFDMTLSSNLNVGSVNLGVTGLRMTHNVTTSNFTLTGNATLSQSKIGTVSVILGCSTASPATTGLILTNGSLSSLDMTVNSNISVACTTFTTTGLRITENTTTNVLTMTGSSSFSVPSVGNIGIAFGGGSTSGLVITNGT
ncbi:MAG: hypothetical protein ACKO85_14235, partial [Isosphaeraceae bacterium]